MLRMLGLCGALVLPLTGCDRQSNAGGTADDSLERARQHLNAAGNDIRDALTNRTSATDTNSQRPLDRTSEQIKEGARELGSDIGRGLQRAGQALEKATTNNATTNR